MGKVARPRSRGVKTAAAAVKGLLGEDEHKQEQQQLFESTGDDDTCAVAASDFGGLVHERPLAVFRPSSASDIARLAKAAAAAKLTLAARGNGHSIRGQAQAAAGVVVEMSSLPRCIEVVANASGGAYVEAGGGELWLDVLRECLRHGLAPKSWTDYLYLTVGGTLSNAGVSGQAFRHGPQISNVLQLEVVTGNGDVVTCSPKRSANLFYAVLGGLGQFGIITRARIELEVAPQRARYVRLLYADFESFRRDIEGLISQPDMVNYVEGSVVPNCDDLCNGWPSVPFAGQQADPRLIPSASTAPVLYCLEIAKYYDSSTSSLLDEELESLLARLSNLPSLSFVIDLSYFDFLNRVRGVEEILRKLGIWDVPHPWLILFVPSSKISKFNELVFHKILSGGVNGPMLAYPLNRSKWETSSSVVIPDESVFYMVGLLRYVLPSGSSLQDHLDQNAEILRVCDAAGLGVKQYFPHYTSETDWKRHFGDSWPCFVANKLNFDPNAILSPGQRIFGSTK